MTKMTVYYYYLKGDNELCAFTADKNLKDEFELERNMNLYHKRKKKMSEEHFKQFSYLYNDKMLFCNSLFDGKEDLYFATTYHENFVLEKSCQELEDRIAIIRRKLSEFPLDAKTSKTLEELLMYYGDGVNESIYRFDTFKLFFKLFKKAII